MTPHEESRRVLALIRFSFWLNVTLALTTIALTITIIVMLPLKEKEPYLLRFSSLEKSFVTVEKADESIQSNKALIRYLLDAYVTNRETIDRATHNERRQNVLLFSSEREQNRYSNFLLENRATIETESFFRVAKIDSVVNVSKSVSIVEFTLTDSYEGSINSRNKYKATIRHTFQPIKTTRDNSYKNPVGFVVEEYQVTPVNKEEMTQ